VPLAGLEPAACCLGDVSAQTLCSATNLLVGSERQTIVIVSSELRNLSRYPARTPSAATGHVHRTVNSWWRGPRAFPSRSASRDRALARCHSRPTRLPRSCPTRAWWCCRSWLSMAPRSPGQGGHGRGVDGASSTSAKHAARAPGGAGARAGRRPGRPVSWTTARPISIALGVASGWLPVK
jgi:hypothetical protein